jgi:hypothetical protein
MLRLQVAAEYCQFASFFGFGNLLTGGKSLSFGTSFMLSFLGIRFLVGACFLVYAAVRLLKQS